VAIAGAPVDGGPRRLRPSYRIRCYVKYQNMTTFRPSVLSDSQARDIYAFLQTLR